MTVIIFNISIKSFGKETFAYDNSIANQKGLFHRKNLTGYLKYAVCYSLAGAEL